MCYFFSSFAPYPDRFLYMLHRTYRYIANFGPAFLPPELSPMRIFQLPLLILFIGLCLNINAQSVLMRVTFPIDQDQTRQDLAKAGLDLTHGHGKLTTSFTTEVQDFQLERFDQLGIRYTIDIADLSRHRNESAPHNRGGLLECQEDYYDQDVPANFELGSVGGFYSLPDVIDQLDVMAFLYPNLISVRKTTGGKTWKNNFIYWVRISDNPNLDEPEPEILYTGLHHAREFISVSQMIYYMWYLLEHYDDDPLVRQIINHTELYFVPVINPDGLEYNADGYDPVEGNFTRNHRKNLHDNNEDGIFDPKYDGVDLNRNYSFHWGHDDEGSSSFPGSDTYRGTEPFSEPETRAIRNLCNEHDFKLALNFHSYGNLLVHPFGYNDMNTPDSVTFNHYGSLLTRLNRFIFGKGSETVGYTTNGDSDDWMYGELGIFAMTPEVGDPEEGFYPHTEDIIPLCQSTLELNLLAAQLINSLIMITDDTPPYIKPGVNPLVLEFNRFGLLNGEVSISFNPATSNITSLPAPFSINLDKFESLSRNLSYTVDNTIAMGEKVKIEVVIQQGEYMFRDTLIKTRADFSVPVSDDGDLKNWDKSGGPEWGIDDTDYKSIPYSISDSPDGLYGPDRYDIIELNQVIDLTNATQAYVQFWAKWDLEDHYDYVVFQVSEDGHNWENLCGDRSHLGSIFQKYEQPLYDGKQVQWVLETTDLTAYAGQFIQLRFAIVTDGFVFKDGFYFDDFKIVTINEGSVATDDIDPEAFRIYPNPGADMINIKMPALHASSVIIYDVLGHEMHNAAVTGELHQVNTANWSPGFYHCVFFDEGVAVGSRSVSIQK